MNQALSGAMSSLELSYLLFVVLFHGLPLSTELSHTVQIYWDNHCFINDIYFLPSFRFNCSVDTEIWLTLVILVLTQYCNTIKVFISAFVRMH